MSAIKILRQLDLSKVGWGSLFNLLSLPVCPIGHATVRKMGVARNIPAGGKRRNKAKDRKFCSQVLYLSEKAIDSFAEVWDAGYDYCLCLTDLEELLEEGIAAIERAQKRSIRIRAAIEIGEEMSREWLRNSDMYIPPIDPALFRR